MTECSPIPLGNPSYPISQQASYTSFTAQALIPELNLFKDPLFGMWNEKIVIKK